MDLNKILKTEYKFSGETAKKITGENREKIKRKFLELGLPEKPLAEELYSALIARAKDSEAELIAYLGGGDFRTEYGLEKMVEGALRLSPAKKGFFLKEAKAKQLLVKTPPKNLVKVLGYFNTEAMLANEDFFELYGSLRFVESSDWMSKFLESYKTLKKSDFEKRYFRVLVLPKKKWQNLAANFIKKKYHNLTHLKELGAIFVLPRETKAEQGVILSSFSLLLHYFNEVYYNSRVFEKLNEKDFGAKLIPLLKGEIKTPQAGAKSFDWSIIPRYLNKEENIDSRYFQPHINPEAFFWQKADESLMKLAKGLRGSDQGHGLDFWDGVDWIGDFFPTKAGGEQLITFNSVDISLSFANYLKLGEHYTYHFQEALWNQVFSESQGDLEKHFLVLWSV